MSPRAYVLLSPLKWFAGAYFFMALVTYLKSPVYPGLMSLAFLLPVAGFSGQRFVLQEQRLPNSREYWLLAGTSILIVIVIVIELAIAVVDHSLWPVERKQPLTWSRYEVIGVIAALVLYLIAMLLLTLLAYGPLTRWFYERMQTVTARPGGVADS